ncbi:MAG: TonB-dependent siderophore receptor [Halomonas sp.]
MRLNHDSLRPLVLAMGLAASLALPGTALAQTANGTVEASQRFDIPAGSLSQALNRLASQAGLALSYDPALASGKTTGGLQGEYSPDQALQRLLAGSGLGYRLGENGTVTLSRQASGTTAQLDTITVQGWRPTATEGYRAGLISSASKTDELLVDVPAAVSVVTEDLIEDQNARSVAEALRNVPGVEVGPNPANVSVQEEFTIRGFENSLINVNGVERRSTGPLSTANVQSVEVLKGPFSVLYGQLTPGGFINVQTKRPESEAAYEISGSLSHTPEGSGSDGRGSVDATGPLNESGSVLYRFIASADGGSSFIDEVDSEQYLINPMLSLFALDNDLRVDLDFSYLRNDETFLFGIPARGDRPDGRIDYTDFLGSKENEKFTEDYNAEVRLEYFLSDATQVDAALTYHLNEHDHKALRPFGPPGWEVQSDDTIRRSLSLNDFQTADEEFEVNLIHNLDTGPAEWRFLTGADVRQTEVKSVGLGRRNILDFDRINVLDPNNDVSLPAGNDATLSFFPKTNNTVDSYGFYAQAETWLHDRLKLLGGVRYDNIEYDYTDEGGYAFNQKDDKVSPRAGVLYKLTPNTSLYGSYSSSFEQEFNWDPSAEPFKPTEAEQWEAGIKQEFFDGDLLATLSAYTLTQENLAVSDPDNPDQNVQIGEVESQGAELELQGQLSDRLRLMAGYAWLDNKIARDPLGNEGNRLGNVPEESANLYLMYDFLETARERFSVGGGAFYTGERFTSESNNVTLDSYTTVDLTAQYEWMVGDTRLELQGGVKNLFNEEYFAGGFGNGIAFRGEPMTLYTTLKANF